MLRIQSGTARGRKLVGLPKGLEVRPILARIRKSMFDIIRMKLPGAAFLDLYAGMGTVGLEAISNGVRKTVFVEQTRRQCEVIQRNLDLFGFADRGEVRPGDATKSLHWLAPGKFDFIFLGPPYKDPSDKTLLALTKPTLDRIMEADLLAPSGVIIAQHHETELVTGFSPRLELFRQNPYGESKLTFFRMKPQ
jgi:16S rRNA (guanine966-N2)-methyltransferase